MRTHHPALAAMGLGSVAVMTLTLGIPLLSISTNPPTDPGLASSDLPAVAQDAYTSAARTAAALVPGCDVPAWILAAIGEIESHHGTINGSTLGPDGTVTPPIIGPALPQLGPDTDNGTWDHSPTLDHAVGPMQFIPATWRRYGTDHNGDTIADPHNLHDAALSAALLLCDHAHPMATEANWRTGLYAYNHSHTYVDHVLAAGVRHRDTRPPDALQLVNVAGIGPTNATWANDIQRMLTHARTDGIILTGSSYRTPQEQIGLRRLHCGTSHYAIYDKAPSQCSPPTARPGTSMHEQGLAIDFHNCSSRSTACHQWLSRNAHTYGLKPLASEPWHWSLNGT